MLLILSAKYVGEDIALEFGRMPPSFLPLGNQRLYAAQAEMAQGEKCFMTVPEDFIIPDIDKQIIKKGKIDLLSQPRGLQLTEAIKDALIRIKPGGPLRILYGDTLVNMNSDDLAFADLVAVQDTTANYAWAFVKTAANKGVEFSDEPPQQIDSRRVVCGYYHFANSDLLVEACKQKSIVGALNYYSERQPLACRDAQSWLDFGHLPLYFQSRRDIQVKRVFNELNYEDHMLVKQSNDTAKIRAEAHWYENLPAQLKLHVPRYGGRLEREHRAGYGIEYLYTPLLSDLAAFGTLPLASWLEILQACFEFLLKCQSIKPPAGAPESSSEFAADFYQKMVIEKTWSRFTLYCEQSGTTLEDIIILNKVEYPPLGSILKDLQSMVSESKSEHIRFWHGDLFFGNMFYDFTARRVLCIDPRGQIDSGDQYLYGDLRYDLAKLAHSIIGQYDKIVLGRTELNEVGSREWEFTVDEQTHQARLQDIFFRFVNDRCEVDPIELIALTALLFFSMLPLHSDRPDLQRHFLATGIKLYGQAQNLKGS